MLFDLNGFKRYNDAFGHPVGDALLARLGQKLAAVVEPEGEAFRLGGDEFCALIPTAERSVKAVSTAAVEALSEHGRGFDISTAYGCIMLPAEAQDEAVALQLVDERLYVDKRSRQHSDAPDQLRKVLLQVMAEREPELHEHLAEVAILSRAVGREMGLTGEELETMVRAAELHDVGKVAVPDAILQKRSELEPNERQIIERHCEVGERILAAAPAMGPVARIVRSSHERYDGRGYPDRRAGSQIPVGARIIAVCDAFHAMTSNRPYGRAIDTDEALAELRANAGSQFDPAVIDAFCAELSAGHLSLEGHSVRSRTAKAATRERGPSHTGPARLGHAHEHPSQTPLRESRTVPARAARGGGGWVRGTRLARRLLRLSPGEHLTAHDHGHRAAGPDADRGARLLDQRTVLELRLPVAALQLLGLELCLDLLSPASPVAPRGSCGRDRCAAPRALDRSADSDGAVERHQRSRESWPPRAGQPSRPEPPDRPIDTTAQQGQPLTRRQRRLDKSATGWTPVALQPRSRTALTRSGMGVRARTCR